MSYPFGPSPSIDKDMVSSPSVYKAVVSFPSVYKAVVGIDVHKARHQACLYRVSKDKEPEAIFLDFESFPDDLQRLCHWVLEENVDHVFMESTGSYWYSLYNALAGFEIPCSVVNPHHVKSLPGHKTDKGDAYRLAKVTCCGLVNSSYLPTPYFHKLRNLSKLSTSLTKEKSAWKNRLNKVLVENGIRLDLVCSDVHGVTARQILELLLEGKTPEEVTATIKNRLKASDEDIMRAIGGNLNIVGIKYVRRIYDEVLCREEKVAKANEELIEAAAEIMEYVDLLTTIPGVSELSAVKILAEIGTDMSRYGSSARLSSWAGLCPGNNESANKRKSGKTRKGNHRLRATMCECAQAAAKTTSQLHEKFQNLHFRRGYKKAIVGLAHKMLRIMYAMIKKKEVYRDDTVNYQEQMVKKNAPRWIKQLKKFGALPVEQKTKEMKPAASIEGSNLEVSKLESSNLESSNLESTKSEAEGTKKTALTVEKKLRGRPKGSKTKRTGENNGILVVEKKPRGRPKGSGKQGIST
jgi:transposase